MTLAELEAVSGVSGSTIAKIERGESKARITTLDKLAHALGMDVSEFVAREEVHGMLAEENNIYIRGLSAELEAMGRRVRKENDPELANAVHNMALSSARYIMREALKKDAGELSRADWHEAVDAVDRALDLAEFCQRRLRAAMQYPSKPGTASA